MSIKENKDGTLISIFVKPNSCKFEVRNDNQEIVVYSTEEPEKGKVNREILKEFSKLLNTRVELVFGITSRQKQLFAPGISKSQVELALKI